jgi:hypothetical protein
VLPLLHAVAGSTPSLWPDRLLLLSARKVNDVRLATTSGMPAVRLLELRSQLPQLAEAARDGAGQRVVAEVQADKALELADLAWHRPRERVVAEVEAQQRREVPDARRDLAVDQTVLGDGEHLEWHHAGQRRVGPDAELLQAGGREVGGRRQGERRGGGRVGEALDEEEGLDVWEGEDLGREGRRRFGQESIRRRRGQGLSRALEGRESQNRAKFISGSDPNEREQ